MSKAVCLYTTVPLSYTTVCFAFLNSLIHTTFYMTCYQSCVEARSCTFIHGRVCCDCVFINPHDLIHDRAVHRAHYTRSCPFHLHGRVLNLDIYIRPHYLFHLRAQNKHTHACNIAIPTVNFFFCSISCDSSYNQIQVSDFYSTLLLIAGNQTCILFTFCLYCLYQF